MRMKFIIKITQKNLKIQNYKYILISLNSMQYKFPKIQKFLYYVRFYQVLFYLCAFHWNITHRVKKPVTTREIYELFYLDFLSVPVEDCEIIELNEKNLLLVVKMSALF